MPAAKSQGANAKKADNTTKQPEQTQQPTSRESADPDVDGATDGTDAVKPEQSQDSEAKDGAHEHEKSSGTAKNRRKKRKAGADTEQSSKAARRSTRGAGKTTSVNQLPTTLNYMLSEDAQELCRPQDESEDVTSRDFKTYSSIMNPFEELLSALILSRPISHRLGIRSIRTVLNDPYSFNSAKAVRDAGEEKRTQALWDAKTQHKDKTAAQLGYLADVVWEKFTSNGDETGTQLAKVLEDNDHDVKQVLEQLKKEIKGFGDTGADIFLRRVQWIEGWHRAFPFIDGKSQHALEELGLPSDAQELRQVIESHWSKLETKHLAGNDEAVQQRRAFVIVLERATGAQLEGKLDEMLKAAGSRARET